jgi:hypothetical protein
MCGEYLPVHAVDWFKEQCQQYMDIKKSGKVKLSLDFN